ncbi:hypothetical protein ACFU5O_20450 [Streptomyces sp. NPDC057445]|uniref:hypothetical protein n=1 Tax=Streptomyces sp. NPDC057445 TaxID=3346136 RepID=UPI00369F0519
MRQTIAHIAEEALREGTRPPRVGAGHALPGRLADGPTAADVWIDGDLGFALLVHRRDDGFVSEELYYSVRDTKGNWLDCDQLGGGMLGFDVEDETAVRSVLAGAPMAVMSESEALVYTGSKHHEDGYESVRILTVLVGEQTDLIDFEIRTSEPQARIGHLSKDVTSPLILAVVRSGQRLVVSAMKRENSSLVRDGNTMEFSLRAQ